MLEKNFTHPAVFILERYKKIIWPEINKYLKDAKKTNYPKVFKIPPKYKNEINYQWKIIKDYPERKGKYLRPTLIALTAQALGTPLKKVIKTASAMQLSEEWILIHDDIEDDSTKRRGKPTLHRLYGKELALNAGDLLHSLMWKVLLDNISILDRKTYQTILDEFQKMFIRTMLGQGVEIVWSRKNISNFSDSDWYFIADGKTSYYTIALPVRLGAIIGGANKKQLEKLTYFGLNLGRGFQLVDDILDITSDFRGLKEKGNDIYEGKKTVILGHLLDHSNKKDKIKILRIFQKKLDKKTPKEISWVIEKMRDYGSIEHAKKLAQHYKDKALEIFEKDLEFLSVQPYRDDLKQIIDFIIERKY